MTTAGKPATDPNGLSPVDALRAIRNVLSDRDLTPAQRVAVVEVILRADNGSGLAWAAYRAIRQETGIGSTTIAAGFRKAEGKHIRTYATGRLGAKQYRIALPGRERATKTGALSATNTGAGRYQDGSDSYVSSSPKKHTRKKPRVVETKKPQAKKKKQNPFADAFKTAFDATFPEPYTWLGGDFPQLATWTKAHPEATPEQFVARAREQWQRGIHTPTASLTIRGLCTGWATLAAGTHARRAPSEPDAQSLTNGQAIEAERAEEVMRHIA